MITKHCGKGSHGQTGLSVDLRKLRLPLHVLDIPNTVHIKVITEQNDGVRLFFDTLSFHCGSNGALIFITTSSVSDDDEPDLRRMIELRQFPGSGIASHWNVRKMQSRRNCQNTYDKNYDNTGNRAQ
jgi:hypothetical protein